MSKIPTVATVKYLILRNAVLKVFNVHRVEKIFESAISLTRASYKGIGFGCRFSPFL
jgi:hypothetical protein